MISFYYKLGVTIPNIAVKLQNLRKTYNMRGKKITALAGINLEIKFGEIFGILGPNGAGKTTIVEIMATLLKPDSGKVEIFGIDALKDERAVTRLIGYTGQDT